MKTIIKALKIAVVVLFLLLIAVMIFIHVVDLRMSQKVVDRQFKNLDHKPVYDTIYCGEDVINVLDNQCLSDTIIAFIHGSPGSARDFLSFYKKNYLKDVRMITFERPGYASSNYGDFQHDLDAQVKAIEQYLREISHQKTLILVSHSYGGAPAGVLAQRNSDLVDGLLLGSVLISPEDEPIFWFNHLINTPLIHWIFPQFITMSNDEKLKHAAMLKEIEHIWPKIECPVYILHGDKDWIAPPVNADYAVKKLKNNPSVHLAMIENQDHLIQLNGQGLIVQGIHWLLDNQQM
jgi:pimeloyl-ACP methyl ester carboxylesterase